MAYDHSSIEKRAQEKWAELDPYSADLSDTQKERYYLLTEFPYPSGDLHIGHWYAFAVTDIYARMLRMRGLNVLFPIGFDAFGLPAENAAIQRNIDPAEWTKKNIERMRHQLQSMGASFDWSKEVLTCDPSYYQWTQWLFLKLFEHGLAERKLAPVKWCPKCLTVLANEQVLDGHCERCGTTVEEKRLTQWFLKITQYAERLLAGLEALPWREEIKEAQRAWIGKSEGAYLQFPIAGREERVKVFTTRPDTVFGATYVVLAPELWMPEAGSWMAEVQNPKEVQAYVEATAKKTERERSENKEKTGMRLEGVSLTNPATKEEIPIYVADYVLASYGTGAVMAVPAHDERDMEFATKYNLPIRTVIEPITGKPQKNPEFRKSIVAIVRNPKTNEVLTLDWGKLGGTLFIGGGREEGENLAEASKREIAEETGYADISFVRETSVIHHHYFAHSKNVAREIEAVGLLFDLASDIRTDQRLKGDEYGKFSVTWKSADVAEREVADPLHRLVFDQLIRGRVYTGSGVLTKSEKFSGRSSEEAKWDMVAALGGERAVQYRLRDWLVSRQRYWGCPIPIVYDPEGRPHAIPAEHLPWLLPTDVDFKPTGKAPLASSKELKERVTRLFGEGWTPEYDTLDTFVDSSWYFLRYLDSKDAHDFSDAARMKAWLPVNRYSGGSEHTTMHVLYARFFMRALYDLALVPVEEPFFERFNRGLIMGPDGQKMSKSKGNVVNPDDFVKQYGADAVRLYLAFIGPYNEPGSYPWNLDGVASMRKFLERVARLVERNIHIRTSDVLRTSDVPEQIQQALARASAKISDDGDRFKLNTAVAALMILMNELEDMTHVPSLALEQFLVMLSPFTPHLAEHLWEKIGKTSSVHRERWPVYDPSVLATSEIEVVVQVNGKRRGSVTLATDAPEAEVVQRVRAIPAVAVALGGAEPRRTVYVPGKIVNFVT